MKTITVSLPKTLKSAEIHTFADLHIGDNHCDLASIKQRIEYVAGKDNAYAILNGDIMNNATKASVSDCYAENMSPMSQLEMFTELFAPIKHKILCITQGNHENRTYIQDGVDLTAVAAKELGVIDRYGKNGAMLFVKIGDMGAHEHHSPVSYAIYCTHGTGGGRKEGAKAIRLADMATIIDADIYIHSHTHLPMSMRQGYYRTNIVNGCVKHVERLFVNTSASLDYGGYVQQYEMKPSSKRCPIIYISGTTKQFAAEL